jgi:AcrR family transcriptional regulator
MGTKPESSESSAAAPQRGGRGARERILNTAAELFYREGIHATGVARIAEVAHVSIRTLYQHFASKNELVEAYLRCFDAERPIPAEAQARRADLAPRERLLAIFEPLQIEDARTVRGCAFHNAAVEAAGTMPEVGRIVAEHKASFRDALIQAAREAGAREPEVLGRQLAVLYEGATALSTSYDDRSVVKEAHRMASMLVEAAFV